MSLGATRPFILVYRELLDVSEPATIRGGRLYLSPETAARLSALFLPREVEAPRP